MHAPSITGVLRPSRAFSVNHDHTPAITCMLQPARPGLGRAQTRPVPWKEGLERSGAWQGCCCLCTHPSAQRTRVLIFVKASRHALNVTSLIIIFHLPYLIRLGSFDFCKTPLITLQIPHHYKQSHHKHFQQSKFYFQQSFFFFYMQERQL